MWTTKGYCRDCRARGWHVAHVCPNCASKDIDNWHTMRMVYRPSYKWWNPWTWNHWDWQTKNEYDKEQREQGVA